MAYLAIRMEKDNNTNWTTILLIVGGVLLALYIYQSINDPSSLDVNIFNWISAIIGATVFFFGVYYTMYGRFPSLKKN